MATFGKTLDVVKDHLVNNAGFTATDIFKHHANKSDTDHILLSQVSNSARTDDGLAAYFNDTVRVSITKIGTVEQLITDIDAIRTALIGLHLTQADIIKSDLINESEPIRVNSKTWHWLGVFRLWGEFV